MIEKVLAGLVLVASVGGLAFALLGGILAELGVLGEKAQKEAQK